jgi:hypothetical protein
MKSVKSLENYELIMHDTLHPTSRIRLARMGHLFQEMMHHNAFHSSIL